MQHDPISNNMSAVSAKSASGDLSKQLINQLNETLISSPAVIYRVAIVPPFLMQYLSPNVTQLLNVDEATLWQPRGWESLVHPAELEAMLEQFVVFLQTPELTDLHRNYRLRKRDGNYLWVADRCQRVLENGITKAIVGSVVDVDSQYRQQRMVDQLMNAVPGVLYQFKIDAEGLASFPFVSRSIENVFGVTVEQAKADAACVFNKIHPDDRTLVINSVVRSMKDLSLWVCEYRIINNERLDWVRGQAQPIREDDKGTLWHGQMMLVTEAKKLEADLKQSRRQLEEAHRIARLGHWVAYPEEGVLYWSKNVYALFALDELSFEPAIATFLEMIHPEDVAIERSAMEQAKETGLYQVEHRVCTSKGDVVWVQQRGELKRLENGQLQVFGTVRDISDQKNAEFALQALASTDALTGVSNRRFLSQQLDQAVVAFHAQDIPFCLVMFDFDNFKSINDQYGHSTGDRVLKLGAELVQANIRQSDVFGRLGGEEFAIILQYVSLDAAMAVAEKLRAAIARHQFMAVATQAPLTVTASFGVVAMAPQYHVADDVLHAVDEALYQAKHAGRNQVISVSSQ